VDRLLAEGAVRTPDLGGTASTTEVAEAVVVAMRSEVAPE